MENCTAYAANQEKKMGKTPSVYSCVRPFISVRGGFGLWSWEFIVRFLMLQIAKLLIRRLGDVLHCNKL